MMALLALLGCSEQGLSEVRLDAIAVVLGDFDDMRTPLTALDIATTPYDGFIVQAVYEPEDGRSQRGEMAADIDTLLTAVDEKGNYAIQLYNAVFVASGARGFGAGQYNNALLEDNMILADEIKLQRLCDFADGGGSLVVSDWAYEIVERCWPDAVRFFGDDTGLPDAAQTGAAEQDVYATVTDEKLVEALGAAVSIDYEYSAATIIESVGGETEVLLRGTLEHQPSADKPFETLDDVPLLVRFTANRGHVVYGNFHWGRQTPSVAQRLLLESVEGLRVGAGDESDTAVESAR